MTIFLRVLWAESLKMKRTVALRMAVVAPMVVVLLVVFLTSQVPSLILNSTARYGSPWMALARLPFAFWAILMMPLYVTLETALIAGLEHAENHWKSLLALPIPRWTLYLAKLFVAATLICASTTLLVLGIILAGVVLPMLTTSIAFRFAHSLVCYPQTKWTNHGSGVSFAGYPALGEFAMAFFVGSHRSWYCGYADRILHGSEQRARRKLVNLLPVGIAYASAGEKSRSCRSSIGDQCWHRIRSGGCRVL
jgi:ABC-2 family transporter protein